MVRKRITKKKSQSSFKPKKSDGKMKKWNTVEDIPMDEEDQFHHDRDKILLEGDYTGGEDDDGDDEEVFALKGVEDDSEGEEEDYAQYGDDDDEEEEDSKEKAPTPKKKKTKEGKKAKGKKKESDDEEEEEEEEEESWGKGRGAYYSSNANELESDDEEGNELEEQESKRLQMKMREEMADDDFGLNDSPELEQEEKDDNADVEDPVPSVLPPPTTDKKALLRHLEKTSPEALALARDWEDTVHSLETTKQKIAEMESKNPDSLSLGMIHMHYQALLSYSTVLAFYLHLRASVKYAQRPALLQSHPIMQRLLTLKQALQTLEDLDFAADSEDEDDEFDEDEESMTFDEILADGQNVWDVDSEDGLDSDELKDLLDDAKQPVDLAEPKTHLPPKKKRKTQKENDVLTPNTVTPVFDLVEPEFVSTKSKSKSRRQETDNDVVDAYGESTTLHSVDAADKTARKKSLRFHTSKIESASARRQGARNQAAGGDDDIPYRERKSVKEARLVKEAAVRAKNQVGVPLDDEEPEPRAGQKRSREDDDGDDGAESPDDYYELVKKKSKEKKIKKKEEYEAASGRVRVEEDGEVSGPRSLTRAILANKGLTPHRPKAVRNPRVKKRQKFEKAKKKISSQKAVYKGGLSESGGRYDGERSGISKVVKSVTLG